MLLFILLRRFDFDVLLALHFSAMCSLDARLFCTFIERTSFLFEILAFRLITYDALVKIVDIFESSYKSLYGEDLLGD